MNTYSHRATNDASHRLKPGQPTPLSPNSHALPQLDRFTHRLFSSLIAMIAVGFVVTLGMAAYAYMQTP